MTTFETLEERLIDCGMKKSSRDHLNYRSHPCGEDIWSQGLRIPCISITLREEDT